MGCDLRNFTWPEFKTGLIVGSVGLVVGVALHCLRSRRASRRARGGQTAGRLAPGRSPAPLPVAGLLMAAATLVALRQNGYLLVGLLAGIVCLAGGGALADARGAPMAVRAVLMAPGAWLVAERAGLINPGWVRLLLTAAIVVGACLVADLDYRARWLGLGPVLFCVTVVGMYEAVPDPDIALTLLGVALPLGLLGWPRPLARLGGSGSAAAVGLLGWVSAVGGTARQNAVIGGLACLGLFVAEPLARLLDRRRRSFLDRLAVRSRTAALVAFVHLVPVYVASHIAGLERNVALSGAIAAGDLAVSTGAAYAAARLAKRADEGADGSALAALDR